MNTMPQPQMQHDHQAQLAVLWQKNLGVAVAAGDDYFALGGDSLRAAQLLAWIRETFGAELSLLDLFESRTLAAQTHLLRERLAAAPAESKPSTDYGYFGRGPLFRAWHRPGRQAATGVVLCHPMGQEYMRIHRTYVELARSIAAGGRHVLRFDYYGCGDSAGENGEGGFARWREDIHAAIDELRSAAGVRTVYLAGARVGANLALDVAAARNDLEGVILWEPIVRGRDYLATLERAHRDLLHGNARLDGYAERTPRNFAAEYLGYPMSEALVNDVLQIDLHAAHRDATLPAALVVANSAKPDLDTFAAARGLASVVVSEPDGIWLKEDRQNKGVIPAQAVSAIATWIAGRDA